MGRHWVDEAEADAVWEAIMDLDVKQRQLSRTVWYYLSVELITLLLLLGMLVFKL